MFKFGELGTRNDLAESVALECSKMLLLEAQELALHESQMALLDRCVWIDVYFFRLSLDLFLLLWLSFSLLVLLWLDYRTAFFLLNLVFFSCLILWLNTRATFIIQYLAILFCLIHLRLSLYLCLVFLLFSDVFYAGSFCFLRNLLFLLHLDDFRNSLLFSSSHLYRDLNKRKALLFVNGLLLLLLLLLAICYLLFHHFLNNCDSSGGRFATLHFLLGRHL